MNTKSEAMKLYEVYHTAVENANVTDEARAALEAALAMGDPEIYYAYSEDLRQGEENRAEFVKWLIKAADGGCAEACLFASIAYRSWPDDIPTDFEKAMHYAQKYVDLTGKKDERLLLRVEDIRCDRPVDDDAGVTQYDLASEDIPWWQLVYEKYPEAHLAFLIGDHFYECTTEKEKGENLIRIAAEQRDVDAMVKYGEILMSYRTREKDIAAESLLTSAVALVKSAEVEDKYPGLFWDLVSLYARTTSGCFDLEKAFRSAVDALDCSADNEVAAMAAYELYWHRELQSGHERKACADEWARVERLVKPHGTFEDEDLLESAKEADRNSEEWNDFWWRKRLDSGDTVAKAVSDGIEEYYRLAAFRPLK